MADAPRTNEQLLFSVEDDEDDEDDEDEGLHRSKQTQRSDTLPPPYPGDESELHNVWQTDERGRHG